MSHERATYGVSGIKLYVPRPRVKLEDWCTWTGASWGKVRSIVGRSFRLRGPHESIYTMAANAVLRLIVDYDVDPERVGYLAFGTESSTDNSAGSVIIRGMVDRALRQMQRPSLSRNCEVPEIKHACLGGVYAIKAATRYLAHDGRGRQAIVVCADIAEYARGSSGEQTQGAGAVALLLEESPTLYCIDLSRTGNASSYRGPDFRKPHRRHAIDGYRGAGAGLHDFPVFSGKYSTQCYIDETLRAVEDLMGRLRITPRSLYHEVAGVFLHRPYHQMPVNAMAALYVWGLAMSEVHHGELSALCDQAGASLTSVLAETRSRPDLFDLVLKGRVADEVYPESMKVVKAFRSAPKFQEVVAAKMALGSERMMDLGNLYTAALPAWIAAGFEEALEKGLDLADKEFLTIGYGSGDAAEAGLIQAARRWKEAAAKIGFQRALEGALDLTRDQYEALHDGQALPGVGAPASGVFFVDRIGEIGHGDFQDVGVEYYRYA